MSMTISLTQIHNHSCFSRRDAHSRIDKLVEKAKENGQKAVALTDHGNLHGIPELFRQAKKHGIKPIAGFEGYFAPTGRETKDGHFHQLVIAKNEKGFKNLIKLSSEAFMSGFHNKPRFDWELLEKHKEGLILTSSCLAGQIPQLILEGELKEARKVAAKFKAIFLDDFYIEIQPTPTNSQDMVNKELIKIAEELDIELVATCDVHFVDKDDMKAHQGMLCLGRNKRMNRDDTPEYDGEENYYLKDAKQVFLDFVKQGYDKQVVARAMNNSTAIAEKVNFDLEKEKDYLPEFPLPEGVGKDKLLGEMVKEGLMRKVPIKTKQYIDRIKFELEVIREKGYQDYFLIVSDSIKFCKENGIMVNFGRGSAAGSLVAYLLDITEVDPIEHSLFFERFLDITRSKMPDIDTDIEDERRGEVLEYLKQKYGHDKVAQIVNYGTMSAKLAFKNALMVYDIPFGKSQEISGLIPDTLGITIKEAYELSPELVALRKQTVKCKEGKDVKLSEVFDMAERFEGVVDKLSTHAGGILITPDPISDFFPVYGDREKMVTQWDKDDLEQLGGVKFDFLGLKTLRTVGTCLRSIKNEYGTDIDIFKVAREANDPEVYKMISEGKTANSFQFNSTGMQGLCKQVKPTEFKHLVAINALYRPPALASGDTYRYARIKNGQEKEHYSHADEVRITGETFGVITYQEHVMELVHTFAGWDYGAGDKLRKMKANQLEELREKFISDCADNGYTETDSMHEIWNRIVQYMGYGFNKSHGVAYTMLSYVTCWLETHYPEHWLAAIMSTKLGDQTKLAQVFSEIKQAGFDFQTPDVNKSTELFTAHSGKIVFPLGAILGVGDGAVEELMKNKPYSTLEDVFEKCNLRVVSARAMKPLILAGAFDELYSDWNRKDILNEYWRLKKEAKKTVSAFNEKYPDWTEGIQSEFEKELLGVYITSHPLEKYHWRNWSDYLQGQKGCLVGGRVTNVKTFNDSKGNRMAFVSIDTLEGIRELVVFAHIFKKYEPLLKKGMTLQVEGKKDDTKLLVDKVKELS